MNRVVVGIYVAILKNGYQVYDIDQIGDTYWVYFKDPITKSWVEAFPYILD